MNREDALSFAYKYPFSKEAKEIVGSANVQLEAVKDPHLEAAKARLEESFVKGRLEYKNIRYGQLDYVIGYAYARMLVSALGSRLGVVKYAAAEAARSRDALESGDDVEILKLAGELGITAARSGGNFSVGFPLFLEKMGRVRDFSLSNFRLSKGSVILDRHEMANLLKESIISEILKGLPIKQSSLPAKVVAVAKTIKPPVVSVKPGIGKGGSLAWIDKLLETPIPDVRHRTVNLVLAPYLVNIKGVSEEDAAKIISGYIERCKVLDPHTNITDSYIRYQCSYAKKRGLKPLSLVRAKELLGSFVEFDEIRRVK
ncbi:MAG TPA: DNA primase noncatalytic subunit PriX, partial [Candidatus Acidoferrum sp.]|nr:DNA primase noncatalytic subunit PriX [Candidatus Acidoferrum sp.]